ncbi:MAG TPA: peptide chain release factor N(5)-glutamine methyltransferase [Hanamia sp.]|nr:peptide chain release factor N(5)-glutamine methyltransferase [Hanamia sp.]
MTIQETYIDFKNQLESIYEDREADNITDWVFEKITGLKKWERRNSSLQVSKIHQHQLNRFLAELLQHKPVQYVLNEAWFYKRKFYVDENVLIPRPETEELVEWIIADVRSTIFDVQCKDKFRIIDIGTGSGCIPVSLKKEIPTSLVTSIDISEKVVFVASKNAKELDAEIDFFQIDFLNEEEWNSLRQFDIIVSNPPYIPIKEKEILAKNVTEFEPGIALFVTDDDPFIFYKKIGKFAQSHLSQKGKIYVEVHEEYANQIKSVFENEGFITTIKKDIYGKERMVRAMKPTTLNLPQKQT